MSDTLLERSVWVGRGVYPTDGRYFWLPDHRVLILESVAKGERFRLVMTDPSGGEEDPLTPFNTSVGRRLLGQAFIAYASGTTGPGERHYSPPSCDLSPDGRTFLWQRGKQEWIAAALDGSLNSYWNGTEAASEDGVWLDAHRWVQLRSTHNWLRFSQANGYAIESATFHDVLQPQSSQVRPTPSVPLGLVLGAAGKDQVLLHYPLFYQAQAEQRFALLDFNGPVATNQEFFISLPEPAVVHEVADHGASQRIAWLASIGDFDPRLPRTYRLWVSDVQGGEFQELGQLTSQLEDSPTSRWGKSHHWPHSVRWLPGGQGVSFVFRNQLYRLDIPRSEECTVSQ
jgi:hypothetical protein